MLEAFGIKFEKKTRADKKTEKRLAKNENMVYSFLDSRSGTLEEIMDACGLSVTETMECLLKLELMGMVQGTGINIIAESCEVGMASNLVIVESPAKVKTIKKFLGSSYEVDASGGHVRDFPKSQFGIDVDNDFEPKYITIRGKGEVLARLRKEVKKADKIYLATDPDREGKPSPGIC